MSALFDVISIINTDGRSDFVLWLRQSSAQHAASRSHIPVLTSLQEEGTDQTIFAIESACSEVMSLSCIALSVCLYVGERSHCIWYCTINYTTRSTQWRIHVHHSLWRTMRCDCLQRQWLSNISFPCYIVRSHLLTSPRGNQKEKKRRGREGWL